jgi:hypothetical protein
MNQYPNDPTQGPSQPMPPYQQPGYPPQMPPYPPQYAPPPVQVNIQQPPKKKPSIFKIGCGAIVALIVLGIIIGVANGGKSSSTTSSSTSGNSTTSQAPSQPQTWQTTHTFTGTGAKKTENFVVGDDWKITWTCQGVDGIDAPLYVTVYGSDGTMVDPNAVATTCKASGPATTDSTEEHQGGNIYLDVNTGIQWSLSISELK